MEVALVDGGLTLHLTLSDAQVAVLAAAVAAAPVGGSVRDNATELLRWLREQDVVKVIE